VWNLVYLATFSLSLVVIAKHETWYNWQQASMVTQGTCTATRDVMNASHGMALALAQAVSSTPVVSTG